MMRACGGRHPRTYFHCGGRRRRPRVRVCGGVGPVGSCVALVGLGVVGSARAGLDRLGPGSRFAEEPGPCRVVAASGDIDAVVAVVAVVEEIDLVDALDIVAWEWVLLPPCRDELQNEGLHSASTVLPRWFHGGRLLLAAEWDSAHLQDGCRLPCWSGGIPPEGTIPCFDLARFHSFGVVGKICCQVVLKREVQMSDCCCSVCWWLLV